MSAGGWRKAHDETEPAAYALTDVQFNAVAQVDEGAQLLERVVYEPYGRALHHRPHDVDGDGDADANDQQVISGLASPATGIADAGYRVEADLNRDGVIEANDSGHFNAVGYNALGFNALGCNDLGRRVAARVTFSESASESSTPIGARSPQAGSQRHGVCMMAA